MTLSADEFKVMLMLYAANTDGSVTFDEVNVMLEKSCPETVKRIGKAFGKLSDIEILDCICKNKAKYAATEAACDVLIRDLRDIIEADEKVTTVEEHLLRIMQRLLKS